MVYNMVNIGDYGFLDVFWTKDHYIVTIGDYWWLLVTIGDY